MLSILFLFLFFSLIIFFRKNNLVYTTLILIVFLTFSTQYLVGRTFEYKSYKTVFNLIFICLNLFLIIKPWSYANILIIENNRINYFIFFKKLLYKFLIINLFLNLLILILVLIYLPDIAAFKAASAYLNLYDQIPYFANIFRYSYTTQNAGYLAIPIFFYHLKNLEKKEALYAFILSTSSLLAGFAFYSRAQIFTYTLVFIIYFLLIKKTLPNYIQFKISMFLKYSTLCILLLFLFITYIRFSSMDYYGDRIPQNSIVKDPILYSLFDYASQSYSNGLYQLDRFDKVKSLHGEQFLRDAYQILNFFGLLNWDVKESQELIDKAYDYDGGAFNGYTAPLVFNFGYIPTILISFLYYYNTKHRLNKKRKLSIETMFSLILLLFIPTVSIFYTGYAILIFPFLFLISCRVIYSIKNLFIKNIILY